VAIVSGSAAVFLRSPRRPPLQRGKRQSFTHQERLMIDVAPQLDLMDPRSSLLDVAIDFPAMTNREQMNLILP